MSREENCRYGVPELLLQAIQSKLTAVSCFAAGYHACSFWALGFIRVVPLSQFIFLWIEPQGEAQVNV